MSFAVHVFCETTLFQKPAALAFDLPLEQKDRLMDCTDHRIPDQFGVGLCDEIRKPGESRQSYLTRRRWGKIRDLILAQPLAHGEGFA